MRRTVRTSNGGFAVQGVFELQLESEFWRYVELYQQQPYSALLDSARDPETLGRYSFITGEVVRVFEARLPPRSHSQGHAELTWLDFGEGSGPSPAEPRKEQREGDPFLELTRTLEERRLPPWREAPVPFNSGAVGYFAYEAAHFIEQLPGAAVDEFGVPQICFFFTDTVWAHDHRSGRSFVLLTARAEQEQEAERHVEERHRGLLRAKAAFEAAAEIARQDSATRRRRAVAVTGHADRERYMETVDRAREHIRAGDVFEVCTTHRLEAPFSGDSWALYQTLRQINPAPFACFVKLPWGEIVSSSPERFLRLDHDRIAESRPIKGTRPRGSTPESDEALRAELFRSVKDRAENVMIVDLVRNDLGRVCELGSVQVPELMAIEPYATVFQMVSTIRGKLRPDQSAMDLVRACFPGGSMTGAPKIEAMKVIDALEPYTRGIYSGSIGYLDDSGALDLNIVIRTFVVKDGRCTFNVGGAVVLDSDPAGEYQETLDKAAALIRALNEVASSEGQL